VRSYESTLAVDRKGERKARDKIEIMIASIEDRNIGRLWFKVNFQSQLKESVMKIAGTQRKLERERERERGRRGGTRKK
jgi:hypothetical protein